VKQITADSLNRARARLADARKILEVEIIDVAAREAYIAAFNAAQALIFERRGTVPRTHRGVHATFAEILHAEGLGDQGLAKILGRAYKYKTAADYIPTDKITREEALGIIEKTDALVVTVAGLIERSAGA
jgi:uncharacterized protein (UPF0332 family)